MSGRAKRKPKGNAKGIERDSQLMEISLRMVAAHYDLGGLLVIFTDYGTVELRRPGDGEFLVEGSTLAQCGARVCNSLSNSEKEIAFCKVGLQPEGEAN